MTCWHLNFQIRYADSEMMIWYSLFAPVSPWPSAELNFMRLHPITPPILLTPGQWLFFLSHNCCARCHTSFWPGMLHSVKMWVMDSSTPHSWQDPLCSYPGIFIQYSPHLCVLWIIFQRNTLMFLEMLLLLM